MKTFKASGILYNAGYKVGTSGYTIADDYLPELVKQSPEKIPVVADISNRSDPDNVVGHATMEYRAAYGVYPACIIAHIAFNSVHQKEWENVLQSTQTSKSMHLGFLMTGLQFRSEDNQLRSGIISAISLSREGLGGIIYKFGWEGE